MVVVVVGFLVVVVVAATTTTVPFSETMVPSTPAPLVPAPGTSGTAALNSAVEAVVPVEAEVLNS